MIRRFSAGEAGLREVELPGCGRDRVEQVLLRRAQEVIEVREDDRGLVEEELLDLLRDRLLRVDVESRDVLLDEAVVLVVLEVRGVPDADLGVAREGGRQED